MNQITDPPLTYDFGYEFNYAQWSENTVVNLCNVPWNNDYRDIVKFPTPAGVTLNQYIDSTGTAGKVIDHVSYYKANTPLDLDIPFNVAYRYNYLRASNPLQPIDGDVTKDLYYFILDVTYVAPNTTRFILQLDVWQTFGPQATFGRCYVERGHIGIANTNNFNNYGRDYLNIPEGLDVGNEYQVITVVDKPIIGSGNGDAQPYNIIATSTIDLIYGTAHPGTVDAPEQRSTGGGQFQGIISGADQYVWGSPSDFKTWMLSMAPYPWITQGIISIIMVPPLNLYGQGVVAGDSMPKLLNANPTGKREYNLKANWRSASEFSDYIPARYQGLKKLFTFPYMAIELTTMSGTPILIKPEAWNDANAKVREFPNFTQPNPRIAFTPYRYNSLGTGDYINDDLGDFLDFATYMSDFPTLMIVNNGAINYLASNAHGIAFQYQNADWSQQRALNANQVQYDQSSAGMNLANELTGIAQNTAVASTSQGNSLITQKAILGSITAPLGGIGGGPAGVAGGLGSAAGANISALMDINNNNAQVAIRNNSVGASNAAQVGNQGYIRDTNKNLADYSARGDYANSIAGINAKVQDAKMIPPTTAGQVGGDTLNIVNGLSMISARFKMIDHAAMAIVCEYWLRYGYSVRRFMQPPADMRCMTKFTYWKLTETYISSSAMPETFKQIIRGIFEKGVTVWSDPAYIGVTDTADNAPLAGISF